MKLEQNELLEALSEPAIGRYFLEKVILALIDGHDAANPEKGGQPRESRLVAAMQAIEGNYYRHGQNDKLNDRPMLLWMAAQQYYSESGFRILKLRGDYVGETEPPTDYANPTELARAALNKFDAWSPTVSERAQTQRLMNKLEENKDRLTAEIIAANMDAHIAEHQLLIEISTALKLAGTPVQVPDEPRPFD